MKFLIYSDIHLEWGKFRSFPTEGYDMVILAGDIAPGKAGVAWAGQSFGNKAVYVAGNHEFYGKRDLNKYYADFSELGLRHNGVSCLQNDSLYLHNAPETPFKFTHRIIGATLWTDFQLDKPQDFGMLLAQSSMNDYVQILDGSRAVTPQRILEEHRKSLDYIETELRKPFDGKTIVVTHHAPSARSICLRFINSNLNHLYCSNLDGLILQYQPDLWVHGHVHSSMDYRIGNTRVVANPRGYVGRGGQPENPNFNLNLIVEL